MPVGHYAYDATLTFPNRGWQVVAYAVFCICLTVNAGILARRAEQTKKVFTTFKPLDSTWLCDVCALLVFIVSFLFIVTNGVLTFAVGTNFTETCDASVTICVSAFVLSKVILYLYYLERLYLYSWAKDPSHSTLPPFMQRFRTIPWLAGIGIFVFGVPSAILLGFSREFQLIFNGNDPNAPGAHAVGCHVFLKWYFATPVIVWCAVINTYILFAFLWPARKGQLNAEPSLKSVCKGSIWSLLVSGVSTVINLSVLLILKGEHGLECLLCCSIDVLANSLVLAIITNKRGEKKDFPSLAGKTHDRDGDDEGSQDSDSPRLTSKRVPFYSKASESALTPGLEERKPYEP